LTTQAVTCTLINKSGSLALEFNATATDDQWNELTDSVNSLSLYKVMKGETITRLYGKYADGCGCVRIRNTSSNKVKMIENIPMAKGQYVFPCYFPVKVEDQDVIEAFVTAEQS